jgi:hypothetical protein
LLKQLLELEKLYLLVLLVRLVRLVRHQLVHLEYLAHLAHKVLVGLLVFQELQALLELLGQVEHLLEQWFISTQTHRSQTQTQETMYTTDTPLTIQIDMDIKFVALTTTTLHTTTLALITPQFMFRLGRVFLNITPLQVIMEVATPLRPTIQIHIAIMAGITTRPIMMDPTVEFITGMDIGGMPIIN